MENTYAVETIEEIENLIGGDTMILDEKPYVIKENYIGYNKDNIVDHYILTLYDEEYDEELVVLINNKNVRSHNIKLCINSEYILK